MKEKDKEEKQEPQQPTEEWSTRPFHLFKEKVVKLLDKNIPFLNKEEIEGLIENPPEEKGDLAFPCFILAKKIKRAPVEIARELKEMCEKAMPTTEDGTPFFLKIEQEGPYLNFFLNPNLIVEYLNKAVFLVGRDFGSLKKVGKRVIVEHTSANPNAPLHVGRARNPIIGDTLARILKGCGYDVTTEYYVNDMGKQAMILKWGVEHFELEKAEDYLKELEGEESKTCAATKLPEKVDYRYGVLYRKAVLEMERNEEVRKEIEKEMLALERGKKEIAKVSREICGKVLEGIVESLENLNIYLDRFSYESDYVLKGSVEKVIESLKKSALLVEKDGAFGLDLSSVVQGRNTIFFFTRKEGTSLYTTRDLAYHLDKLSRCDIALNILGEDHKLQSLMLKTALEELAKIEGKEPRFPEVVFYSFVTLKEGKMSTRRGRVVYFDELINEGVERAKAEMRKRRPDLSEKEIEKIGTLIGKGAVRFNIIKVQPEKPIKFSWKDALNFEGDSAPFVMYAAVRAGSILKKGGFKRVYLNSWKEEGYNFKHEMENRLIKQLSLFPEVVKEAGEKRAPHLIAGYALRTAAVFNLFYRDCKVLESGEAEKARLSLVFITKVVLTNAMEMLGIKIPDKM